MDSSYTLVSGGAVGARTEIDALQERGFGLSIEFVPKRGDVLRIKQDDYERSLMIINVVHDIVDGERVKTRLVVESVETEISPSS